jgi:hypothetical protein
MGHDFEPLSAKIISERHGPPVGLLINFNASTLVVKRIVLG